MDGEQNTTTEQTGVPPLPDGPLSDQGDEDGKRKRGRGRPKKDEPAQPLTPEPPPKRRKDPADIRDRYAAIKRLVAEQQVHIDALREERPETECCDAVDPFEAKRRPGAPVSRNAFLAPVKGLTLAAGALGDVREQEMPRDEDYIACADEWARASTHLGLSEKAAAMFSAISETVRVTGFTLARSVRNMVRGHNGEDVPPKARPGLPEAVRVEGKAEVR